MPLAALALALLFTAFTPQSNPAPPVFEVASIRPGPPSDSSGITLEPGGRWRALNSSVGSMVQYAFGYTLPNQVVGGPDWVWGSKYEVNASAGRDVSRAQVNLMVQRLLQDRFGFKHHIENREVDVYALVADRADKRLGPGLKPAATDCAEFDAALARGGALPTVPIYPDGRRACGFTTRRDPPAMIIRLLGGGRTIASLAERIIPFTANATGIERNIPVFDRSGIGGRYDVTLDFLMAPGFEDPGGQTLRDALRDQLGLRLEKRRERLDVLVIDGAREPTLD